MSFNPRQWDRLIAQGFQAGSQNPLDWLLRDHARLRARVEELEQVQGVGAEEYLVMRHRAHEAERLLKTSNDEVAERERDEARTALRALANEARWAFFHGNVCAAEQWNASETRKTVLRAEEILSNEGGE